MGCLNIVLQPIINSKRAQTFSFFRNYILSCERDCVISKNDKYHMAVPLPRTKLKAFGGKCFNLKEQIRWKIWWPNNFKTKPLHLTTCSARNHSYSPDPGSSDKPPPLMDFPEIVWPNLSKTLKNWIMRNMIIRPYFDREFDLPDFTAGSKQAVETVSGFLANGDFDSLQGLVHEDTISKLKQNIGTFSVKQRQEIATKQEDIYFSFPYQIGIMFNEDDKNQKRFVEITMVHHVVRGLNNLVRKHGVSPFNVGFLPEFNEKFYICNYRFIKEFTKGVDSSWTINVLNHFKPGFYDADISVKKN